MAQQRWAVARSGGVDVVAGVLRGLAEEVGDGTETTACTSEVKARRSDGMAPQRGGGV